MALEAASIRRFATRSLAIGLSVAAAAAIVALLSGSFDDTDGRVILTSIAFAVAGAVGATGAAAGLRPSRSLRALGGATLLASAAAFCLLLVVLWADTDGWDSEGVLRAFGACAVVAVAGSHACLVLMARRPGDSDAVRVLTVASLGLAALDAGGALLPILDLVDEVDDPWPRLFAAALVLLVLTSVLPPLLRRVERPAERPPGAASEILAIADRIDALNSDPGIRAPEIRAELARLRTIAQSFEKRAEKRS